MSMSIASPLPATFREILQSSQFVADENESQGGVVEGVVNVEDVFEELLERGLEGNAQNEWRLDC